MNSDLLYNKLILMAYVYCHV